MTTIDTAYMPVFPWGSNQHFPLFFQADRVTNGQIGITQLNKKAGQIKLMPTIANDELNIQVLNQNIFIKAIEIYNGSAQKHLEWIGVGKQKEQTLNISQLKQGIYFIKITDNLNNTYYEKFILVKNS